MLRGLPAINSQILRSLWIVLALTFACQANAEMPFGAFWRHRVPLLSITTTAQSLLASLCSGTVTVQARTASGAAYNVPSNLTVNLSGRGTMTYYSDAYCTTAITSTVITTGTNSKSFYFVDTAVGTSTITAAATGYVSAAQNQTLSTNGFIWTGAGGNASWSTAGNWSGGVAPGSSNVAVFDGTCSSNCSPTVNSNINIKGVRINSTYSGTITQSAGFTLTIGSTGWEQTVGTFTGSSSGDAIAMNGPFILAGGTFTATSGAITASVSPWFVTSGTFVANSGTIIVNYWGGFSFTAGSATYNNLTIQGYSSYLDLNNTTMNVGGNLVLNATNDGGINNGTLNVGGNITGQNAGPFSGNALLRLIGNASGQTVSTSGGSTIPNLTIVAGANPVTLSGNIQLTSGFTYTSGTLTVAGSTLTFQAGCGGFTVSPGSATYNNVAFGGSCPTISLNSETMNVGGDLTFIASSYGGNINSGTLAVGGNVTANGTTPWGGSFVTKLVGNAAGQTVTTNSSRIGHLTIAAGTNDVTFSGNVKLAGDYIVTSVNNLTTTGSSLIFEGNCSNLTITPGTATYNNVTIGSQCSAYSLGNGTMTVAGNLTLTNPGYNTSINSGTILVSGNVTTTGPNSTGGNAVIQLAGNASGQTVSGISGGVLPALKLATGTNPVTFSGTFRITSNYIVTSVGTFTSTGSSVTIGGPIVTVGSEVYNNVTFGGNCQNITLSGTMNMTGNLAFYDTCMGSLSGGAIAFAGNLSTSSWGGGSTTLTFNGSSTQTITHTGGVFPGNTITMSGAGVQLASNVSFNAGTQTVNVTTGSINMAGYNLTVKGLVLNGNTVTRSAGTLIVNGSTVPAGTQSLYGGTINP